MTLPECELRRYRNMYGAAVLGHIEDRRGWVTAAMRGEELFRTDGKKPKRLKAVEAQIAEARRFLRGPKMQFLCDCAGITLNVDRVMQYITGGKP